MRKLLSVFICFLSLFFILQADAQTTRNNGYVINGTVTGIDSGVVRMLSKDLGVRDSAVIVNGKFVFRGNIGSPERRTFMIIPGNWAFKGFVEDTAINFWIDTSDAMHQYYKTKDYPIIWQITETGSAMADVYTQYQNETGDTYGFSLLKKLKTAKKDSIAHIRNEIDSIGKLHTGNEKVWIDNYISQNPSSLAGIYIFNEYCGSLADISEVYLRSAINQFSGTAKASSYYDALINKLSTLENKQANSLAPDFTLLKRDKSKFTLSTTRGSVTMLDFWASWCVPCRKGIPHWKKMYAKFHHKGFNIVSVSDDRYWNDWIRALDKEKMPWTQVIDEFPSKGSTARVGGLYALKSIPFFILLNKEGKVIIASGDEDIMTKKIEEILQ
ncbi:TlpA disulfide reductase family protein [Mucilaginibacter sabulilitoris]|uniref:TlpA disulfide reductase family protein n=1 Tax=Mucilaginibacter sabulilitoris TaxID=1173583 RepID=A0ABZ0TQ21_9SPHI|nr:TlpA disulfide reductase family protein [Mucilaginibacter sabulilitoris]WPU95218.1 TlpA disulfide reductase family protein [Mucilaginibacter sabulilitoris]